MPKNNNLDEILVKVACLNQFYSTNLRDIYTVSKHIFDKKIDAKIARGDIDVVDEIANIEIKDKTINFFSFATKYCFNHFTDKYWIYDSYVLKMLCHFKECEKKRI